MIKELSKIFGSKTKAQEILLLKEGVKEVVRQGFYERELIGVKRYCEKNQLHLVTSRFKVLLADNSIYSNKGIRIPESDNRNGMFFVYISKNEEKAWLAAYHEMMNNSRGLGLALGYPTCCVEYFCKNFNRLNTDLQQPPINPWTNLTKRDQDCVFLSHFPCSPTCAPSIRIAKLHLDILEAHDLKRAREMLELLNPKK